MAVHRTEYLVTHPLQARADQRSCTLCHEPDYCTECHTDFAPEDLVTVSHRRQFRDLSDGLHSTLGPETCQTCHTDSVLPVHEWTEGHSREARRDLLSCQSCHPQAEVCLTCHSAREGLIVNPHPANWNEIKNSLEGASGGSTCRACH